MSTTPIIFIVRKKQEKHMHQQNCLYKYKKFFLVTKAVGQPKSAQPSRLAVPAKAGKLPHPVQNIGWGWAAGNYMFSFHIRLTDAMKMYK